MARVIRAARALGARGRTSCKRQVSGSNPLTGSQVRRGFGPAGARIDKCRLRWPVRPAAEDIKSERAAQIEFGKLLEQAAAGRQPDLDVTETPAARPVRVNPPGRTCQPGKPTSGISAGPSNPRSGPRRSVRPAAR